jgi:hypothetical protein
MKKAGYTCHACGLDTLDVEVRQRREHEDIIAYVDYVMRRCGFHHRQHAAKCTTDKLDLKLPISAEGIGIDGAELTPQEQEELRVKLAN